MDTLAPVLFIVALEDMFRKVYVDVRIKVNGEQLNYLILDDDIILFAESDLYNLNQEGEKKYRL